MKKSVLVTTLAAAGLIATLGAGPAFADSAAPTSIAFTDSSSSTYRTLTGTPNQQRLSNTSGAPRADSFGAVVDLPATGTTGQVRLAGNQCLRSLFGESTTTGTCSSTDPFQKFDVVKAPQGPGVLVEQDGKVLTASKANPQSGMSLGAYQPGAAGVLQNVVPNK